jgi:ADP-ribosylglycohydrolase
MLGAICGDVLGSVYESPLFTVDDIEFPLLTSACRYTDDSVLTCAIADAILNDVPYELKIQEWYKKYPNSGYGSKFVEWAESFTVENQLKNDSYSNGSMMRVSPIGYAFNSLSDIFEQVDKSVAYTHNNAEARNGARAIAAAVFLARKGRTKQYIKDFIQTEMKYDLEYRLDYVRTNFEKKNIRCSITGPQALIVFLSSNDYENTVRNAIYSRGDCDTISAIAGSIAYPFYKEIPEEILKFTFDKLPQDMALVISKFHSRYPF